MEPTEEQLRLIKEHRTHTAQGPGCFGQDTKDIEEFSEKLTTIQQLWVLFDAAWSRKLGLRSDIRAWLLARGSEYPTKAEMDVAKRAIYRRFLENVDLGYYSMIKTKDYDDEDRAWAVFSIYSSLCADPVQEVVKELLAARSE
jgi:hypothetical protein